MRLPKSIQRTPPMVSLEALFCHIDDFCQVFEPRWQATLLDNGLKHRKRARSLSLSEIMTILVAFHQQGYRNFKHFYQKFDLMPLCVYLKQCFGHCSGISFIDSRR